MEFQSGQVWQDQKERLRLEEVNAAADDVWYLIQNQLLIVAARADHIHNTMQINTIYQQLKPFLYRSPIQLNSQY